MEVEVLNKIYSIMELDAKTIKDRCMYLSGIEVLFLAQYIERLEEKEQMLNALLSRDNVVSLQINNN